MNPVTELDTVTVAERYLTKTDLARHLQMTPRWINYRMADGMPHHRWGRAVRFRLSEVEAWLEKYESEAA